MYTATSPDTSAVSLERIISQYVWRRYLKFLGSPRRHFAKRSKYVFQIGWSELHFAHQTRVTELDAEWDYLQSFSHETQRSRFQEGGSSTDSYVSVNSDVDAPVVLCATTFENTGDVTKRYKISTQKEMPVSVSVTYQQYYVLSDDLTNIEVTLPSEILPLPQVDRLILETFVQSDTFDDVCTLDISSSLTLKAGHRAEVMCVAYEEERTVDFEVETTMSLSGLFPVVLRRTSDNAVVYTCFITDLSEVFRSHTSPSLSINDVTDDDNRTASHVSMTSRGRCKVSGWKDRQVIVMRDVL